MIWVIFAPIDLFRRVMSGSLESIIYFCAINCPVDKIALTARNDLLLHDMIGDQAFLLEL